MKWKVLSSEYLYKHEPYIMLRKDVCCQPNGKIVPAYYVAELPVSVTVFPVIDDRIMMVKQYRHPLEKVLWELPGGFTDKDEAPDKAAIRELREETGYLFKAVDYLGKTAANPGILNNYTHMFVATGHYEKTEKQEDDNEDIEIGFFSFEEINEKVKKNEIVQSLNLNAILLGLMHLGKLKLVS